MWMLTMASVTPSFTFKEFCPLYYLLNAIPTRIQKGFRSIVVYLTALDTNGDYIAVGSSIGMLYLYCRHLNQMKKYNFEGKSESITVVKLLSCFDDLVAAGTASGRIAVFQLVSSLPGRNKQLRRFDVSGIHKSSITALAWSPNGMKLFSGDDKGKIVYSALDFDQGRCHSSLVLEEPSSIVQLDYSQKVLLVSTLQRSLLFYTEEKSVKQVGTQPRKSTGKIGACFIPGLCKQSDLTLFAARPGIRLWKSDVFGTVQATYILKDVFTDGMKPFELYPRMGPADKGNYNFPERQLGLISCFFQEGWVISWNEYSIYLLDTVNQALIGSLEGSGDIVSVSCTENEIFLLKGDRDIIRLSSRPEGLASIVSDVNSKATCPISDLSPKLQSPLSVVASVSLDPLTQANQKSFPSPQTPGNKNGSLTRADLEAALVAEKFRSQSFDGLGDLASDPKRRGCSVTTESRSRSSSVNSVDSGSSFMTGGDQEGPLSSQRFSTISSEDFNQELIVKPIKVKKKKKKRPDSLSIASSLMSGVVDSLSIDSPDQESLVLLREENGSETFSPLQSPELGAALTPKGNGEALELLKLSPGDNEMGVSPATDSSASGSPTLLADDKTDNTESGRDGTLLPEFAETTSGQLSQDEEDCLAFCETEQILDQPGQPSSFVSLKDTEPVNGILTNVEMASSVDESFGREIGGESLPKEDSQQPLMGGVPPSLLHPLSATSEPCHVEDAFSGQDWSPECNASPANKWMSDDAGAEKSASSDEEDIYGHGLPRSSSETGVADVGDFCAPPKKAQASLEEGMLLKSDQTSQIKPLKFIKGLRGAEMSELELLELAILKERATRYSVKRNS
uniref:Uncharacterized protein n=1 Tax=Sphaerodactylus townsendi TaxID=933632 RepID=A0ACB8G580_9SAUR